MKFSPTAWKLLASLLVLCSTWGSAQILPKPTNEYECRYDGSVREMNACAIKDFNIADAEMNNVYFRKVAKITTKEERQKLLEEQRGWLRHRDKTCRLKKEDAAGTNGTITHLSCLAIETERRTLALRERVP